MSPETIAECVSELKQAYPGALRAEDGGRTLVKLPKVYLPEGCSPATTEGLVLFDPSQPKPKLYVRDKPRTPRGVDPRNVNPEIVGGQTWHGFSFNVPWEEGRNTALQLVESSLRRFAKDE